MRRPALALACLAASLAAACDMPGAPDPKTSADAERRAYEIAAEANDTAAIALDIGTMALHLAVEVDADRRAGTCKGSGVELQRCQYAESQEALANGQPYRQAIDEASALQLELRAFLIDYNKCAPGTVDRFCQANALAKVAAHSPRVKAAVEAARKRLKNVRAAH